MTTANHSVSALPYLGSGLGYRRELRSAILEAAARIDFLEIVTDQFTETPDLEELQDLGRRFTIVPHGIGLSIGSMIPLDEHYLRVVKRISDCTGSPYYSEHLCMTRAPGIDIGHLAPLWFSDDLLAKAVDNVSHVQDMLGKPLVLENVTYLFEIPGARMRQPEFFSRLVDATGCGILLDVTNLHINSVNHQFDPVRFMNEMPLDHVVQVHLAGGYRYKQVLIDGHSESVPEETWELLEKLVQATTVQASIIERDSNFPDDISEILEQVDRARTVIARRRSPSKEWKGGRHRVETENS